MTLKEKIHDLNKQLTSLQKLADSKAREMAELVSEEVKRTGNRSTLLALDEETQVMIQSCMTKYWRMWDKKK